MMLRSFCALAALCLVLSACTGGNGQTVTEADKTSINCLAAQTVKQITDEVAVAIGDVASQDDLRNLTDQIIKSNAARLGGTYASEAHNTYHEYETRRRLNAIQNALMNRSENSPDQQVMDETYEMAKTCVFGA